MLSAPSHNGFQSTGSTVNDKLCDVLHRDKMLKSKLFLITLPSRLLMHQRKTAFLIPSTVNIHSAFKSPHFHMCDINYSSHVCLYIITITFVRYFILTTFLLTFFLSIFALDNHDKVNACYTESRSVHLCVDNTNF